MIKQICRHEVGVKTQAVGLFSQTWHRLASGIWRISKKMHIKSFIWIWNVVPQVQHRFQNKLLAFFEIVVTCFDKDLQSLRQTIVLVLPFGIASCIYHPKSCVKLYIYITACSWNTNQITFLNFKLYLEYDQGFGILQHWR